METDKERRQGKREKRGEMERSTEAEKRESGSPIALYFDSSLNDMNDDRLNDEFQHCRHSQLSVCGSPLKKDQLSTSSWRSIQDL